MFNCYVTETFIKSEVLKEIKEYDYFGEMIKSEKDSEIRKDIRAGIIPAIIYDLNMWKLNKSLEKKVAVKSMERTMFGMSLIII